MAFDFKKEYSEFYMPKNKPQIVTVPPANYIAVRGMGDPNEEGGAYKAAISVLYAVAYTIKMSKMGDHRMAGYFDFVVPPLEFDWAVAEAARKKKLDCSAAEFLTIDEGQCVQIMHVGPFDDEPASVALMDEYLRANGYENDFSDTRLHHEIYLSDARKVAPEKWKTVIRHPVRKAE